MERLNAQLKEQQRQKALLNVHKQEELAANPFRLFDKGTNRKFNLRETEMRDKHLQAQLKTTTDIAMEKDGISAAEKDQIENIKIQIRLNKIKLGQAQEEMGTMYDIKDSFLGGLESGLTNALQILFQAQKVLKMLSKIWQCLFYKPCLKSLLK